MTPAGLAAYKSWHSKPPGYRVPDQSPQYHQWVQTGRYTAPGEQPTLEYGARVNPRRVMAMFDGELDCQELVTLAQDVLEAGSAADLGPAVYRLVVHCATQKLLTTNGRYLH